MRDNLIELAFVAAVLLLPLTACDDIRLKVEADCIKWETIKFPVYRDRPTRMQECVEWRDAQ